MNTLSLRFSQWTHTFALSLIVVASGASNAQAHVWPPIGNDAERLAFVAYVHRHWPKLFETMMIWDADIFEQLEKQSNLHKDIAGNELYEKLAREMDQSLAEMRVQTFSLARRIDTEKRSPLVVELQRALDSISPNDGEAVLLKEISALTSDEGGAKVMNEFVEFIDRAERGAFFKLSSEEKLKRLAEILPHGELKLKRRSVSREQALVELRQAIDTGKLRMLVEAHVLLQDTNGRVGGTRSEWDHRLEVAPLDVLVEKNELSLRLEKLNSALARIAAPKDSEAGLRSLHHTVETHVRLISAKAASGEAISQIVIREVPPELGIFRGCAGNDCSFLTSASYVDYPQARTYFLFDRSNAPSGYVTTWDVESGGNKALYFSNVLSADLPQENVESIAKGMQMLGEKRGLKRMVIPAESQIIPLNNDWQVQGAFREMISGKSPVDIHYPGETLFPYFDAYAYSKHYAAPKNNSMGHVYVSKPDAHTTAKITLSEWTLPPVGSAVVTRAEASIIAFKLRVARRPKSVDRILRSAGVDENRQRTLERIFLNSDRVSLERYYQAVAHELETDGMAIAPAELRNKSWNFLKIGSVQATDAFQSQNARDTIRNILWLSHDRQDLSLIRNPLLSHAGLIESSPEFSVLMGDLLRDSKLFSSRATVQDLIDGGVGQDAVLEKWSAKIKNGESIFRALLGPDGGVALKVWDEDPLVHIQLHSHREKTRLLAASLEGKQNFSEVFEKIQEVLSANPKACPELLRPFGKP